MACAARRCHALVRQGLRTLLESYDVEQAVGYAGRYHQDVILMDINLPRLNGIHATRRIKEDDPKSVEIGLSVHASTRAVDALLAPARGHFEQGSGGG